MTPIQFQIAALFTIPRLNSCTESDNVALSHAVDSASFKPSPETLSRLVEQVRKDQEWNPHCYPTELRQLHFAHQVTFPGGSVFCTGLRHAEGLAAYHCGTVEPTLASVPSTSLERNLGTALEPVISAR